MLPCGMFGNSAAGEVPGPGVAESLRCTKHERCFVNNKVVVLVNDPDDGFAFERASCFIVTGFWQCPGLCPGGVNKGRQDSA